ncbi:hypothetical protein [Undibacterium aquatile]|uniref:ASCH domain-containing protein n=1 Tax=Undibacterium aquatile TaxID=1537398 RepID=A0ABR6XIK1_9BURK|nr:hypothetical protein [Undibacterium aquatile]MBC3812573.1 hypothetical protein [Undibacterium aquatile]
MSNNSPLRIPSSIWSILKTRLFKDGKKRTQYQLDQFKKNGQAVQIRLKDTRILFIKVDSEGVVKGEAADIGHGYWIEPTFASEDIESWGYDELVWSPTFFSPLKRVCKWRVLVKAGGA